MKMIAMGNAAFLALLAVFWPWIVSYPVPESYAWLTVIDKLPIWVGRLLIGGAALAALLPLWLQPLRNGNLLQDV